MSELFNNLVHREIRPRYELIHFYKAVEDVKGVEALTQAKEKRNELGDNTHIIEVLDQLKILTEAESAELICEAFSPSFPGLKCVRLEELQIRGNKVFFDGEEVRPCAYPTVGSDDNFVVLEYTDLQKLHKLQNDERKTHQTKRTPKAPQRNEEYSVAVSFKDVVKKAIALDASDIHITFSEKTYSILFRVDGILVPQSEFLMRQTQGINLIKSILIEASGFTKGEFNSDVMFKGQDARIEYPDLDVDLRLAFTPDGVLKNNCLVARILKKQSLDRNGIDFVGKLGYDQKFIDAATKAAQLRNGLYIASGITGSGKSTFISSIIASAIPETERIFTIENPIEYRISGENVTQHQIFVPKAGEDGSNDKKMDFMEYVRMLKRSDPDVAFIGEMRKEGSLVETLIEMSEAGQLVFTTVHIKSAFGIYNALEHVFKVPYQTSVSLILFSTNQVLVKRLCPHCKKPDIDNTNAEKLRALQEANDIRYAYTKPLSVFLKDANIDGKTFIVGEGCPRCEGTGYLGRVPVNEYFRVTQGFMEKLSEKPMKPYEVEKEACSSGIGVNKLTRYLALIKEGTVDTSEPILRKII